MDMLIPNTAAKCLFLCWDLRGEQAITGSLLAAETDAYVEIALKSWLTYLFQTTHTLQLPPLHLIKQDKSICLAGLDCINSPNLYIYH